MNRNVVFIVGGILLLVILCIGLVMLPRFSGPAEPRSGQQVFISAGCIACHGANGQGDGLRVPPLAGSTWVQGEPARLKRILLHGMVGPIQVGDRTFDGVMPDFYRLSDAEIANVLTYIRTNSLWGNSASPILPESVTATRAATAGRRKPFTANELMKITADEYNPPAPAADEITGTSFAPD
jgi:mono/diheme cytochrome c family protein